jgi:hypothetical protein
MVEWATLILRILEERSWFEIPTLKAAILTGIYRGFSESKQADIVIGAKIASFRSFPINFLLITLPFYAIIQ